MAEVLGNTRRADLPSEHTGPRGFRCRGAILTAVVAAAPLRVVAHRRPCLRVTHSVSVDDVAGVAILGLPTRVKDPLPGWRSALVGWLPRRATCVNECLLALGAAVIPRTALLVYAGC
jgi:hypothetical protein